MNARRSAQSFGDGVVRSQAKVMAVDAPRVIFAGTILLTAGLLTFFHIAVFARVASEEVIQSHHHTPFVLSIEPAASPEQRQMFLRALLSLPHVETVNLSAADPSVAASDAANRMEFSLRSLADFDTVFTFLNRKELQSILVPSALSFLPAQRLSAEGQILEQNRMVSVATFLAFGSFLLFALSFFLYEARLECWLEFRLLKLFGANRLTAILPCVREGANTIVPSWLCALAGTGIVIATLGIPLPSLSVLLMMIVMEGVSLVAILLIATVTASHFFCRTRAI